MVCSRCGAPVKGFQFHCERCKNAPHTPRQKRQRLKISDENDAMTRGPAVVLRELESDFMSSIFGMIGNGIIWVLGLTVSVLAYTWAKRHGGYYIVFGGAFLYGFWRFMDNIGRFVNLSRRIRKLKKNFDL